MNLMNMQCQYRKSMKVEPYSAMDRSLISKRADIVKNNEKFSQNILHALREVAEEKEQSKTQEDI